MAIKNSFKHGMLNGGLRNWLKRDCLLPNKPEDKSQLGHAMIQADLLRDKALKTPKRIFQLGSMPKYA